MDEHQDRAPISHERSLAHPRDGGDAIAADRRFRERSVSVCDDELVQSRVSKGCRPRESKHLSHRYTAIGEEQSKHAMHSDFIAGRVSLVREFHAPIGEAESPASSEGERGFLAPQEIPHLRAAGAKVRADARRRFDGHTGME